MSTTEEWRAAVLRGEQHGGLVVVERRADGTLWMVQEVALTLKGVLWEKYNEAASRAIADGRPLPEPPRDENGVIDPCVLGEPVVCITHREYRLADPPISAETEG